MCGLWKRLRIAAIAKSPQASESFQAGLREWRREILKESERPMETESESSVVRCPSCRSLVEKNQLTENLCTSEEVDFAVRDRLRRAERIIVELRNVVRVLQEKNVGH